MRMLVAVVVVAAVVGPMVSMGVRCDPEKHPNERAGWVARVAPGWGGGGIAHALRAG